MRIERESLRKATASRSSTMFPTGIHWLLGAYLSLLVLSCVIASGYTDERYDTVVVKSSSYDVNTDKEKNKNPLTCYYCYSGDQRDCQHMSNISQVETRTCQPSERFCKVRRLHYHDKLVTFDRECSEDCKPGCIEAARYLQCVSCCNHENLCNADGAASVPRPPKVLVAVVACVLVLLATPGPWTGSG